MILRIESDKEITKLLKRHKKYKIEYDLNISEQGYSSLVIQQLTPIIFTIAIAEQEMKFFKEMKW